MTFTLRQIRYALAVAETGHFGRAADLCHVTQPALSQQVALIEARTGLALFDRQGRQVVPTPFGREFLARARRVRDAAEALDAFADAPDGRPQRPLRLGLIPTIAPYLLPAIMPALATALPEISITASESQTDPLLARLHAGEVDLALIATEPPASDVQLHAQDLFFDPFVLAVGPGTGLAEPTELSALPPGSMLLLDEGHCFRDQAIAACGMSGHAHGAFAATSLSTIVEMVAAGQGVTLLPAISLKKEAIDPRISLRELAPPVAGRMLRLVWHAATPYASLFTQMAGIIRTAGLQRLLVDLPAPQTAM